MYELLFAYRFGLIDLVFFATVCVCACICIQQAYKKYKQKKIQKEKNKFHWITLTEKELKK